MNESAPDTWFYTQQGERVGPVSFSDLKGKASDGTINPRLDMAWSPGMSDWKHAGEIEGLFERKAAPEAQETQSPAADPYRPPTQDAVAETMAAQGEWPGARRRSYLIATLLFPILWQIATPFAAPLIQGALGQEIMTYLLIGIALVPLIVTVYFGLNRLVNLGMSRWWFLGNLVPFLNLWVGYRCFACPAGYAYHKKLDGAGVFLAIVYWLLIVIGVLLVIAFLALLFGTVNNPELRNQMQEILRQAQEQAVKR